MKEKITSKQLLDLEAKVITLKENGYSVSLVAKRAGMHTRKLNRLIDGTSCAFNAEEYESIVKFYLKQDID